MPIDRQAIPLAAERLATASAVDILHWAAEQAKQITFATGFGVEGCVLIDLIARHRLPIDLFTLDTGLLFPETYALWRALEERYGVTIRGVHPALNLEEQERLHGAALWERQPDRCCELRKVVPLRQALIGFDAWITAIRREQTVERASAQVVEWDPKFNLVKLNPLAFWSTAQVSSYVEEHQVPTNPLHQQGFPSIGCSPCTSPVRPGEDLRAGRWRGREKTECGLHGAKPVNGRLQ